MVRDKGREERAGNTKKEGPFDTLLVERGKQGDNNYPFEAGLTKATKQKTLSWCFVRRSFSEGVSKHGVIY